jgi:hypothetical protein
MSQLTFDASFINTAYSSNKIYTNSVQLDTKTKIATLDKVLNTTKDSFGGTKKTTNYIIPGRGAHTDLEVFTRALIQSFNKLVPGYDCHFLNKRAEFWIPRGFTAEEVDFFNAARFSINVVHDTKKVWITPILTAHLGDDDIDREDEDGNSKREYPNKLVLVKGLPEPQEKESLLIPNPLRRNRALPPVEEEY